MLTNNPPIEWAKASWAIMQISYICLLQKNFRKPQLENHATGDLRYEGYLPERD